MLFLVVSTPRADRPTEMAPRRRDYWRWLAPLQAAGTCRHVFARAGRGAVAVFEVASNEELHRLLNEWAEIIPAHFDVYPLIDTAAAKAYLGEG
jgi:muconolactone delta-isomerase